VLLLRRHPAPCRLPLSNTYFEVRGWTQVETSKAAARAALAAALPGASLYPFILCPPAPIPPSVLLTSR